MQQPFRQGDLDGLCGIYAILNALKLLYPNLRPKEGKYLLFEIFRLVHTSKSQVDFIIDGINPVDISRALKHIVCSQYDITYTKPFHRSSAITVDELWNSMTSFLSTGNNRAIIIVFGNHKYSHYTVVKSITDNRLILHDSDSRKVLNRRQLSTNESIRKAPFLLYPTSAFYLQRQ